MANAIRELPEGIIPGCDCNVCGMYQTALVIGRNPVKPAPTHVHEYFDSGRVTRSTSCACGAGRGNKFIRTHVNECRCRPCWYKKWDASFSHYHKKDNEWRAYSFFYEHLSTRQRFTLTSYGYVDVRASNKTKWRLDVAAISGNAYRLSKDDRWWGYCIIAENVYYGNVPAFDQFLSQLLMLRTRSKTFNDIGICTGIHTSSGVLAREWVEPE